MQCKFGIHGKYETKVKSAQVITVILQQVRRGNREMSSQDQIQAREVTMRKGRTFHDARKSRNNPGQLVYLRLIRNGM